MNLQNYMTLPRVGITNTAGKNIFGTTEHCGRYKENYIGQKKTGGG